MSHFNNTVAINALKEQVDRIEEAVAEALKELAAPDAPTACNIAAGIGLEKLYEGAPIVDAEYVEILDVALKNPRMTTGYAAAFATPIRELQAKVADLEQIIVLKDDTLSRLSRQIEILVREVSPTRPDIAERLWVLAKEADDA